MYSVKLAIRVVQGTRADAGDFNKDCQMPESGIRYKGQTLSIVHGLSDFTCGGKNTANVFGWLFSY